MANPSHDLYPTPGGPLMDTGAALRILVVDQDRASSNRLSGALARLRPKMGGPVDNGAATSVREAEPLLSRQRWNVIIIDPTYAPEESGDFILRIRRNADRKENLRGIVFVLYGEQSVLRQKCETYAWWERLQHYYRLGKGGTDEQFEVALAQVLERVSLDVLLYGALWTIEEMLQGEEPPLTPRQLQKVCNLLEDLLGKVKRLMKEGESP